jgi:cytochrome c553
MSRPVRKLLLILTTAVGTPLSAGGDELAPTAESLRFFETKVRPVLLESCLACHGPDKQESGLRVDHITHLFEGGTLGPAVIAGQPEKSLLLEAIRQTGDLKMPPKGPPLAAEVVADIHRWIKSGAPWPESDAISEASVASGVFDLQARKQRWPWIWESPQKQPLPAVVDTNWPLSEIDHFVLARLEEKGLKPAAAADRRVWIRRVTFDLIGLPPTPEEVDAFVVDATPRAYEKVVDRLLDSLHFGERWARHWMDLVRYAESAGHEHDFNIPNAYQYRDYVIRAFNADVPYRQFVMEHLAGDLLPEPRLHPQRGFNESVLGTGWAFLGEEVSSPVDIRQDELERTDNKLDVLSKTFLALTVSCARCHNHKFDAISQHDYYALAGFVLSSSYRQVPFESMEHNRHVANRLAEFREQAHSQICAAVSNAQEPVLGRLADLLLAARKVMLAPETSRDALLDSVAAQESLDPSFLRGWVSALKHAAADNADPFHAFANAAAKTRISSSAEFKTALAHIAKHQMEQAARAERASGDTRVVADYTHAGQARWIADGYAFGRGPVRPGEVTLAGEAGHPISRVFSRGCATRDPFWNGLRLSEGNETSVILLAADQRSGRMIRTPTFTLQSGKLHYLVRGQAKVYAGVDSHLSIRKNLHARLMTEVGSGLSEQPVWCEHDLTPYVGHRVHVEFGPVDDSDLEVLMVVDADRKPEAVVDANRILLEAITGKSVDSPEELARAYQQLMLAASQRLGSGNLRSDPDVGPWAALADWLVQHHDLVVPPGSQARARLVEAVSRPMQLRAELQSSIRLESHTAPSWLDGNGVDEHVLVRGSYKDAGPEVPRRLPAAFPNSRSIELTGSGRLELAKQLVEPANPLVARVFVNRVWQHLFGRGVVATVDNFGYLGQRPSHPELLDHLAHRFVSVDDWSLKCLIRQLVLSSTYRMSSRPNVSTAEQAGQIDPKNILLHRMPIRRLESEAIRDAILAVSGQLDRKMFGPPVPVHLTEFLTGNEPPPQSGPRDGAGRRSIYIAIRRNFPSPMMHTFDAPIPFGTVGLRNVTNVPAQSLVMMNDPFVHDQAVWWARRILKDDDNQSAEARIDSLFRAAFGRSPTAKERTASEETLKELATLYKVDANSIDPWAGLCHALFNVSEFLYVR